VVKHSSSDQTGPSRVSVPTQSVQSSTHEENQSCNDKQLEEPTVSGQEPNSGTDALGNYGPKDEVKDIEGQAQTHQEAEENAVDSHKIEEHKEHGQGEGEADAPDSTSENR